MADNLIFPIGFDLEEAVKKAGQEWNSTYADKLEKLLAKRAITVNLGFSTKNLNNLDDVKRRLAELKIEPLTPENKTAIQDLVRELKELAKAMEKVQKYSKIQTPELQQALANKANAEAAHMAEKYRQANERLEVSKRRVALAEQKHAEALSNTSKKINKQLSYVSRLINRMAVYASFSYAGNFLTSVREATAQFELQRVSLGAIIQDQHRANQLFAEIKSFALTSPLKILDLTKYTKQVAAYGIETEKLFDTTKMLADISVGLGVDMSRLTLFYGQVYATGYLRASELRQATEAGIPLVAKLSKQLEELNGREYTAAEVMDLISKRAISFDMVEQVFKDMTSAGGEFYNMQVKQSQTLFGMWSKLGDAAAIMYDQIGNTSSVNAGMKTTIGLLESMMRNWKTTARVLDTVGVALAVYVIGLKNTAIASKAVTIAEAQRMAVEKGHLVITPKLVTAIIGKGRALDLSIKLTNLHTTAMAREAAATNVLTRGFWKLTAAMLANPWIAAAAAIAGVAAAIIHFAGNAETAAERAEKLNNSIASLKSLTTEVEPLIDTYKELADKTERTADEQKKLNEVAIELAQKFPAAITVIKEYGQEMGLAADEVARLYENMKQMKTEDVRQKLTENENAVNKLIQRRQQLQKYFDEGKMWVGGGGTGGGGGAMMPMSDKEKRRITTLITDIDKQILELNESIISAKRELGELPSETAQAIEGFGAWKKKLTEFSKDVGGIKVRLFDDSTIEQFGTLEEALDAAAKKYNESARSVKRNSTTLKQGIETLGQEQFDKISAERDEAQAMKELSEEALVFYNAMALVLKSVSGGRSQSDPRLGILQEMVGTLKQVNKEYDELAKKEGAAKALADTQNKYANTFKYLQSLVTKYEFELPDFGVPTDAASLTKYLDAVKEAMKKLPESEKTVLSLETDISDIKMADAQKEIEAQIKELADRISRTKTAREFYNKVLGMTGDYELAMHVSTSIYGGTGKELDEQIKEQFRLAFKTLEVPDVDVSAKIGDLIDKGRYEELRGYIGLLPEDQRKAAEDLVKAQQQMSKQQYEQWLKDLEKQKGYADKRIELSRYTANQIAAIEERIAKLDPAASDYEEKKKVLENLIKGYQEREDREDAKLEYEQFTNSALYLQMFENLDNASKSALERMRDRIIKLKEQWKDLSPTEIKELQKRLDELDKQIAGRNPFKTLYDSIKKLRDMRKAGRTREGDEAKADAAEDDRKKAKAQMLADEKAYEAAVKQYGAESNIAKEKRKIAEDSKKAYEDAEKAADNAAKNAHEWEDVADAIDNANDEIDKYQGMVNEALDGIRKMMEAFGASDEDMQFFDDVVGSLNEIVDAGQQAAASVGNIMSGNPFQIFQGVTQGVGAISGLVSGLTHLFSAGKIKRANKEIKRQQELLDRLEYTYSRLEKSAESVFGASYIDNYNRQIENLRAQAEAYRKQAEAEESKGKDADDDKIKEYQDSYRDTLDKIADLQSQIANQFLGQDLASAAREFAQAWLDAYQSYSNTTDAMSKKFNEMLQNMAANTVLSQVMKQALSPVYEMINGMSSYDFYKPEFFEKLVAQTALSAEAAANGAEVMANLWKKYGIDLRGTSSDMTGTSRDIASASEESINGLAAGINTQNSYISYVPTIAEHVTVIRKLMETGYSLPQSTATIGWTDWQQQAMDSYLAIQRNTADTVVECRRAANACEEAVNKMSRVIKVKGATQGINVFMN